MKEANRTLLGFAVAFLTALLLHGCTDPWSTPPARKFVFICKVAHDTEASADPYTFWNHVSATTKNRLQAEAAALARDKGIFLGEADLAQSWRSAFTRSMDFSTLRIRSADVKDDKATLLFRQSKDGREQNVRVHMVKEEKDWKLESWQIEQDGTTGS